MVKNIYIYILILSCFDVYIKNIEQLFHILILLLSINISMKKYQIKPVNKKIR